MSANDEVTAVCNKATELYNDGKFEELATMYAKDCLIFKPSTKAIKGREALLASLKQTAGHIGKVEASKRELEVLTDEAVMIIGNSKVFDPSGKHIGDCRGLTLWRKLDGQWLISRDCYNVLPPE